MSKKPSDKVIEEHLEMIDSLFDGLIEKPLNAKSREFIRKDEDGKISHVTSYIFDDGLTIDETLVKQMKKTKKNAQCPCNSGKKFKRCCMDKY